MPRYRKKPVEVKEWQSVPDAPSGASAVSDVDQTRGEQQ